MHFSIFPEFPPGDGDDSRRSLTIDRNRGQLWLIFSPCRINRFSKCNIPKWSHIYVDLKKKYFNFVSVCILSGSEQYVRKSMKISTEIRFVHIKYIFYTLLRINLNILRKSITKEKKNKTNLTSLSSKLREI